MQLLVHQVNTAPEWHLFHELQRMPSRKSKFERYFQQWNERFNNEDVSEGDYLIEKVSIRWFLHINIHSGYLLVSFRT